MKLIIKETGKNWFNWGFFLLFMGVFLTKGISQVGIGTTNPDYTLDVEGTIGATNIPDMTGNVDAQTMVWDNNTNQFGHTNVSTSTSPYESYKSTFTPPSIHPIEYPAGSSQDIDTVDVFSPMVIPIAGFKKVRLVCDYNLRYYAYTNQINGEAGDIGMRTGAIVEVQNAPAVVEQELIDELEGKETLTPNNPYINGNQLFEKKDIQGFSQVLIDNSANPAYTIIIHVKSRIEKGEVQTGFDVFLFMGWPFSNVGAGGNTCECQAQTY